MLKDFGKLVLQKSLKIYFTFKIWQGDQQGYFRVAVQFLLIVRVFMPKIVGGIIS
jgi:hypothetical protein